MKFGIPHSWKHKKPSNRKHLPLQETNISPFKGMFEDDVPLPLWWDMLVSWRVAWKLLLETVFFWGGDDHESIRLNSV